MLSPRSKSPPPSGARFVIVGNPENRRVVLFQAALERFGLAPALVVPWLEVIQQRVAWERMISPGTVLRIDSPGENFGVERALLESGANLPDEWEHAPRLSRAHAAALLEDRGRIRHPRQWYRGFRAVLFRMEEALNACARHTRMHSAADIALMFDKVDCQQRLAQAGLPIPPTLGTVTSFDELIDRMNCADLHRVFIKLAHGSSASGVVAFERSRTRMQAFTTAQLTRSGGEVALYNSLKVRRYRDAAQIALLIDTLTRERVQVEAWIPKASMQGRRCDLRVLVIAGRARHTIVRLSSSPMTNLHLGNARGDAGELAQAMGAAQWESALAACERAMHVFPGSLYAGIDLLVKTGLRQHAILEVNAFGDLLPNALHEGQSTYDAEIAALLQRMAQAA